MYLVHDFDTAAAHKRRQFPRYGVQCCARILIGKRQYAGYIQNISQKGAKLRTITSIRKLGTVILKLPDLPPLQCRLSWTDHYHAGVSFERALTKAQLRQWMDNRSMVVELNGPEADCSGAA